MPTNHTHNRNPLFVGRGDDEDDDDLEKLVEEEELVFENQNLQDVDLEKAEEPWENGGNGYWPLRVKSVLQDIQIRIQPTDTVAQVKQAVLDGLGEGRDRYVRLVCKGRMLAPDSAPLRSLNIAQPNDVVHAVLTDSNRSKQRGVQAALQQGHSQRLSRRALRSAGINASGVAVRRNAADHEDDEDEEDEDELLVLSGSSHDDGDDEASAAVRRRAAALQRRGFDRLRSVGLRRAEIQTLRAYFSRQVDRFVEQNPNAGDDELEDGEREEAADPLLRRRLQEEAWMQSQGPLSEFRLNLPSGHALALMALLGNNNGNSNNSDTDNSLSGDDTSANPWLSTGDSAVDREALIWRAASGGASATTPTRPTTTTTTNTTNFGNDRDFLCGFLLGFFVGFIMLVWVWMPTVPHKQKLGILTGITVQLALALLRPQTLENENETSPNSPAHLLHHSGYAHLFKAQAGGDGTFDTVDMDDGIVLG